MKMKEQVGAIRDTMWELWACKQSKYLEQALDTCSFERALLIARADEISVFLNDINDTIDIDES